MVTLNQHQEEVLDQIKNGSILCGGVGSGKSRTALAYYFLKLGCGELEINGVGRYSEMKNLLPLYIITTARKRDTLDWEHECIDFAITPIVDSWNNIQKYVGIKNAFFIFDEQRVIGSGEWVKSFLKIAAVNRWMLLSATPGDTWMDYIPVFIANGFYKNRTEFIRRHVVYNHRVKFPKVDHYVEIQRLIRLRNSILVNMHFVRKTVRHVIDVPCDYDRILTERLMKDRWNVFTEKPIKNIAELCFFMRKVANSDISRLVRLQEIFEKHSKIIIFYNFNYELDALKTFCEDNDISYAQWNGHEHQPLPKRVPWAYLVQYSAGAEGWNAIETNCVVFYSLNYSYKMMEQASGRIDRMNTPFVDLYYYQLMSSAPIDKAIRQAYLSKKVFNENVFHK